MWPLPAGYLLEITLLGVGGLVSVSANRTSSPPLWGNVTWAIGGVFLSLAVLGAWSIGPSVVPALLALVAAAILAGVRRRQKVFTQVGWFAGGVMGAGCDHAVGDFLAQKGPLETFGFRPLDSLVLSGGNGHSPGRSLACKIPPHLTGQNAPQAGGPPSCGTSRSR